MDLEINHDRPITTANEDRFGRALFAKKITNLCQSHTAKSRVIGIYGKWGEGKTSLLNLVKESLDPGILQIHFNPWFFIEEEQLLLGFFKLLAEKLGKNLNTKGENINNLIAEYGESVGILESVPQLRVAVTPLKGLVKIFKGNKKPTTETARNRINDFIINSGLNIVIFIDDIDRLDMREVSIVFKLVKLLADFPRTTYVLSFDPDIVARMLAPLYGGIVPDSGYQFLEKVIQMPLSIPKAHDDSILLFVQDTIREVAKGSEIDLAKEDNQLSEIFADGLLVLLNNPRKVIRFGNAFRFTYPILKDEVNTMDLLIIEAFKASLPEYYAFIRANKELFLQDYLDEKQNQYMDSGESASLAVTEALKPYTKNVCAAIRELTKKLFPRFVWIDPAEAKLEKLENLLIQKRICTYDYFDRYFTFSIQPQEISDIHFNQYYLKTGNLSIDQIADQIVVDYEKFSMRKVALKLATYRSNVRGEDATKLILALCKTSGRLIEEQNFDWGNPFSMIALTVDTMVRGLPRESSFQIAKEIILSPTNIFFAAELTARFTMPESREKPGVLFSGSQGKEIKERYIGRLKTLLDDKGFFDAMPEEMMLRQLVWWNDIDHYGLREIVSGLLDKDDTAPLKLLRIFTPTVSGKGDNAQNGPTFKADFTEDEYLRMEAMIGVERIYQMLSRQFGDMSHLPSIDSTGYGDPLDDSTLIGKFQKLYQLQMAILAITSEDRQRD